MINKDNFKAMLKYLNFEEKGSIFTKNFEGNGNYMNVYFTLKQIEYPDISGLQLMKCKLTISQNLKILAFLLDQIAYNFIEEVSPWIS